MYFSPKVVPPPQPVVTEHVGFSVMYLIVRGDGHTKMLESLTDIKAPWVAPGGTTINGTQADCPQITIPLDLFTALRLGLIQEHELSLPEGVQALFNMIK